ncbi:MAG TPA: hypothetical protein VFJ85_07930 [Acidimicrobiales bacterium]|nr:hypothetical protein [Acidimicrobiales bacterium]
MPNTRRTLVLAAAGVAALVALTSAAFACTDYRGFINLSANGSGSGTVTGYSMNGAGMVYCPTNGTPTVLSAGTGVTTVTVSGGKYVCPDNNALDNLIKGDTYHIKWADANAAGYWNDQTHSGTDCMGNGGTDISGAIVVANGLSWGPFTSNTFTPAVGKNVICFQGQIGTIQSAPQMSFSAA